MTNWYDGIVTSIVNAIDTVYMKKTDLSLNIDDDGILRITTDNNNNVYVGDLYPTKSYVDNKVSEVIEGLGISSSYNNGLFLIASKKIIQSTDTCRFVATVFDSNHVAVSGASVSFSIYDSDDVLLDTLTGSTSYDGVASVVYTGTGVGEVYCIASVVLDNSTVVSEPYTIDDSIWYDTDGSKFTTSNVTVQNSANGVVVTATANWGDLVVPNSNYMSSLPIRIEFEMVSISPVRFLLKTGSSNYKELNTTGKYVINVTSSVATVYKDNTNIGTITLPDIMDIRFRFVSSGDSITFKNFRIYKE